MASIVPREYQERATDDVFRYFAATAPAKSPLVLMPTATGKSVVIARLIQRLLGYAPQTVVWALTHVKELIEQNADKLRLLSPNAPFGIVSAGMNRRDIMAQVVFGGVKTVDNVADQMVPPDVLCIDEAHLLSPNAETVYQKLIARLRAKKPWMRVVGFTATGYRLGQGLLTNGETAIFDDICCDMTTIEWFAYFVYHGYIVPPRPKRTKEQLAVASVGVSNGDYKLAELNRAVDKDDINWRISQEMIEGAYREQRQRGLVFCSGIDHAEHIAECLTRLGQKAFAVHQRTKDRDAILAAHKRGDFPILTNNNVLTTGYDDPRIDWIGCLRPTVSTSLWVQMLGRGTRACPEIGKRDCIVFDHANNTIRLGPINDPHVPREKGKGKGEAPMKWCDNCGNACHASVRVCPWCQAPFEIKQNIIAIPSMQEMFRGDVPEYKTFTVDSTAFLPHVATSGRQSIKVSFHCGSREFKQYINFESVGFQLHIAHEFWRRFVGTDLPTSNNAALDELRGNHNLNMPVRIKVHVNRTYPEIVGYEYY